MSIRAFSDQQTAEILGLLKRAYHYDPDTGLFRRRNSGCGQIAGEICGTIRPNGYRLISLGYKKYPASRLAWLYCHGRFPAAFIDHANGLRADDRIGNLREATNAQNMQNKGPMACNTSGFKGVTFHRRCGKWQASIKCNGVPKYLGIFETPEAAHAAYAAEARVLHGEFARLGAVQ